MASKVDKHRDWSLKDDAIRQRIPMACADEASAVEFLEEQRGWDRHPTCPHCESENVYQMKARDGSRNARYLWRCRDCGKHYTVRANTVMEDSRIALRHWCYGFWRVCSSKKGVSALEIRRQTGLTHKSALFMLHRIRWALHDENPRPLGGKGKDVEADETYVGGKPRYPKSRAEQRETGRGTRKTPVMCMVERGGEVRLRVPDRVTSMSLGSALIESCYPDGRLLTDEWPGYTYVGRYFRGGHERTKHSAREYARGDVHSNTAESVFSLLKRGITGTWHSISVPHLFRYLDEFAFRWNTREDTDGERMVKAIQRSVGKRLRYVDPA